VSSQVSPLPLLQGDDGEWDHTALPNRVWPPLQGRGLAGCVLVLMKSDAMGERIRYGTPLLVDTNITQITDDNGVYVLLLGDALLVRRVQRRLQGAMSSSATTRPARARR
jgi:hypothetical protein